MIIAAKEDSYIFHKNTNKGEDHSQAGQEQYLNSTNFGLRHFQNQEFQAIPKDFGRYLTEPTNNPELPEMISGRRPRYFLDINQPRNRPAMKVPPMA